MGFVWNVMLCFDNEELWEEGEEQARDREQRERQPPGDLGEQAAESEADRRPRDLAGEDVAVDAPALAGGEVVAGQRRDRRPGGGVDRRHDVEGAPRRARHGEGAAEGSRRPLRIGRPHDHRLKHRRTGAPERAPPP